MNAKAPVLLNLTVRVTRIRSVNRKGCIAFGHRVDLEKSVNDRSSAVVIVVPSSIAGPSVVTVGAIYEVYGDASVVRRDHSGFAISETQVQVQALCLVKPSGSQLVQWLADNVPRIREVKANKLWDALGEKLYEVLETADHKAIEAILPTQEVRDGLFAAWTKDGDRKTLRFVQDKGIPLELARKVIRFHQHDTVAALLDDPYRLLSFSGSWTLVDDLARSRFFIQLDDSRRLAAALEEALYRASEKGHTCSTINDLTEAVKGLLHPHPAPSAALATALRLGRDRGQFIARETESGDLILHAPGSYLMERHCAEFIYSLLRAGNCQQTLFATDIDSILAEFEAAEQAHLKIPAFSLNGAQREAVKVSFSNRFSIITGGAGVGKTTVLKALYKALDTLGRPRFQMALSGRATARMIEATQEEAMTIAGFLKKVSDAEMGPAPVVIIDEASMLDLVTFHRLAQKLPSDAHVVLVGDPYQLPPIGAGLVLHVLCELPGIPVTQLTEVKRQSLDSGIPRAAHSIRQGRWPDFSEDESSDVAFLACSDQSILPTVLRLYEQDRDATQILCATRSCTYAGIDAINRTCHQRYKGDSPVLVVENLETGVYEQTGFCEGDLLLYTANDWARNLQNGCLGRLTEVYNEPPPVNVGSEEKPLIRQALGSASFEGVSHYLFESDIDDIQHAYAITVHKSQGSQFRRVIVPVRKSRILDRTFVYTALTRAQVQVIFVGDVGAVKEATRLPPHAFARQVGLRAMLEYMLTPSVEVTR